MGLVGASGPAFAWPESFFWGGGSFRDSVAFLIGVVGVFGCGDPAGCGAPVVFPLGQDFGGGRGLWGAQEESPFGDDGLVVGTGTAVSVEEFTHDSVDGFDVVGGGAGRRVGWCAVGVGQVGEQHSLACQSCQASVGAARAFMRVPPGFTGF